MRRVVWLALAATIVASCRFDLPSDPAHDIADGGGDNGDGGGASFKKGDINGDGYSDFVVGAGGSDGLGVAHVYLGSPTIADSDWNGPSPSRRIDLSSPSGPSKRFGDDIATIGDVNGDGYADFVVAALSAGWAYLYLGSSQPDSASWNGVSPARRIDIAIPPNSTFRYSLSISGIGDVNKDGYSDFLIGQTGQANTDGQVWLYLGDATPASTIWNGSSPARRISLIPLVGASIGFGSSLAGAGDINGDGYSDFLIRHDSSQGPVQVYLGSANPSASDWSAASSPRRIDVVANDGSAFGVSLAGAGDVNRDGYSDFLITSYSSGTGKGAVRLYFGMADPASTAWNGPSAPARLDLTGPDGANSLSYLAASAGDINADGYADFLIGAGFVNSYTGIAHLYLGSPTPSDSAWAGAPMRIDLASPAGGSFGYPVASPGDVNGDGNADFLIGAYRASSNFGSAYLYLGAAAASASLWNGSSPPGRIDLISPDAMNDYFGGALACTEHGAGQRPSAPHPPG